MRLVISDTSPLNYLLLIGEIEVLPKLFTTVIVPAAVVREMTHPRAPKVVSNWAGNLPNWVEERLPLTPLELSLGAGETEAIALAMELSEAGHEAEMLLDDREASAEAELRGLRVVGTLAVLVLADEVGLLEFEAAIDRLRTTNFHLTRGLVENAIASIRHRRGR